MAVRLNMLLSENLYSQNFLYFFVAVQSEMFESTVLFYNINNMRIDKAQTIILLQNYIMNGARHTIVKNYTM